MSFSKRLGQIPSGEDGGDLPLLLDALRLVVSHTAFKLTQGAHLALRGTCRAFREVHDQSLTTFNFGVFGRMTREPPPSAEAVEKAVRCAVSRGFRPQALSLSRPGGDAAEERVLALLNALAPAGSVTSVSILPDTPVNPAVAAAIAGVSPKLTRLTVFDYGAEARTMLLELTGPHLSSLELTAVDAMPGPAIGYMSYCTSLRKLKLICGCAEGTPADEALAAEESAFQVISQLRRLEHLDLNSLVDSPQDLRQRAARARPLLLSLSTLTALTRLDIQQMGLDHHPWQQIRSSLPDDAAVLHAEGRPDQVSLLYAAARAEWRALVELVQRLPRLQFLRTCAEAVASDLSELVTLTTLRVGSIVIPEDPTDRCTASYDLPPKLQRLETSMPLSVNVLAALRPPRPPQPPVVGAVGAPQRVPSSGGPLSTPPCLLLAGGRLCGLDNTPWCLEFSPDNIDSDEVILTPEAAARMRTAASVLTGFDFMKPKRRSENDRGLRVQAWIGALGPVRPPHAREEASPTASGTTGPAGAASAGGGGAGGADAGVASRCGRLLGGGHCASWLSDLVAVVRPRYLELQGLILRPRDMLGLARCLEGVESLRLKDCSYTMASIPLLAGLASLRELNLDLGSWAELEEEDPDSIYPEPFQGAFLGLTACVQGRLGDSREHTLLPLPAIRRIIVACPESWADWLERVVAPAREELAERGDPGEAPELRVMRFPDNTE